MQLVSERSVDTQAAIEFSFVFESPKDKNPKTKPSKRSLSLSSGRDFKDKDAEFSRCDSYEHFFNAPEG